MVETGYHVLASNEGDRDEKLVGLTPSYAEALEWAEQARMDGWQRVRVDAAKDGANIAWAATWSEKEAFTHTTEDHR